MKVAVVGAGGFIGRRLCEALAAARADVLAVSSRQESCFDPATGILRELPAAADLDALVYLAQSPHYRELPTHAAHVWGVNVVSAVTAAHWARSGGACQIIYASSGSVYRPAFTPHAESDAVRRDDWYALSKIHGEEALALVPGVRLTCLRLFGVYGPGQEGKLVPTIVSRIRAGDSIRLQPHPTDGGDRGGLRLSLCHVDDVVRLVWRLLQDGGPAVLNVAGREVLSVRDIASAVGRLSGVAPVFEEDPEPRPYDLIADTSRLAELSSDFVSFETGLASMLGQVGSPARRAIGV